MKIVDVIENHERQDERRFDEISHSLNFMKDNHLAHIERDVKNMSDTLIKVVTNVGWITKLLMALIIPMLGGFIAAVYALLT